MVTKIRHRRESPSLEDYLEAIHNLSKEYSEVGVNQISEQLDVKKPSASGAVKRLKEKKLVNHHNYGPVTLTEKGRNMAQEVVTRHKVLFTFFTEILDIDEEVADEDACQMEHYVSKETLNEISTFVDFMLSCPYGRPVVLTNLDYYRTHGERSEHMKSCGSKSKGE